MFFGLECLIDQAADTAKAAAPALVWPNLGDTILTMLRWVHILAGIIWIGHLYFFNLVQGPFEKPLDGETKKKVIPELRPRALFWFRWGAMVTMLAGVALLGYGWHQNPEQLKNWFSPDYAGVSKNLWISMGMLLGMIMWFNVWFIIWPNQQVIINGIKTGNKAPDHDARIRKAFLASRFNMYVSGPMLFGMIFGSHVFTVGFTVTLILMPVAILIGLGVVHHLIGLSGKVGTEWSSPAAPPPPAAPPAAK